MRTEEEHLTTHALDQRAAELDAIPTSAAKLSCSDKQVLSPGSPQVVPLSSSFSTCPTEALESNLQKCWAHATMSEVRKVVI